MPSISLPTVAAVAGTAGAAISAAGAISGGLSSAAQARYQAQVAQNNQVIAAQNAEYALQAGGQQTYNVGLQERERAAKITTGFAANNIDVNTGSAAQVRASQAQIGEQAQEQTAANAALTAYGYRTQQTSFAAESALQKAAVPRDIAGGLLGGAGTLLSSASNISLKFGNLAQPDIAAGTGGLY